MSELAVALVHYPVRNRAGETITTSVTNLDVHDIARSARTYDVGRYYVVTPIEAQRRLVGRILEHWIDGSGARRIPERGEALLRVACAESLADAVADLTARSGATPRVWVTGARAPDGVDVLDYASARATLREAPTLVVFGTGHGLSRDLVASADAVIAPIEPEADYNHLSVRAAAAITLDRLASRPY